MPAVINPEKCNGCQLCIPVCPIGCITGRPGTKPQVTQKGCIRCGACKAVCESGAIAIR
ncbi:MAG TPA: 4Fe-4S binding protein [Candidatus Sumerlaeota bacterium]|nr:4Fe-4S binding protein [Candidatus Sumerlaeota bacterium]HPS02756.1 4Fe-4S binding protein [Candidatus Sumerlaeota bacterium]